MTLTACDAMAEWRDTLRRWRARIDRLAPAADELWDPARSEELDGSAEALRRATEGDR